jgi:hypothetical protein
MSDDGYSDDGFEDDAPKKVEAPAARKPQPPPTKRQAGAKASPKARPRAPAEVAPVGRIIGTPPAAREKVEQERIIDAEGNAIPLDSPRFSKALVESGVLLEELRPIDEDQFVLEAEQSGLPAETGTRRYYAFEMSRQSAVQEALTTRTKMIKEAANNRWGDAGSKLIMIRKMFEIIDEDQSGTLEMDEFTMLIKTLGMEMMPHEVEKAFNEMDEDHGGTIDFEEFQKFYFAATESGTAGAGKRLGKELLANLHANLFNQSIQAAKSKMGKQMLKERALPSCGSAAARF